MTQSWTHIPHVTTFDEADVTELDRLRAKYEGEVKKQGGKLTLTVLTLKAVVSALKKYPQFNASLDERSGEIVFKHYYNIGIAVATERGLIVPVIKDVDKKSLVELSAELAEIAEKTRAGKIELDRLQGGTFTVTNIGAIGGTGAVPMINFPECAILAMARAALKPVVKNGNIEPGLILLSRFHSITASPMVPKQHFSCSTSLRCCKNRSLLSWRLNQMVVGEMVQEVDLVIVGAGPGGYTAALRAAELGIKTLLVDSRPKPGGVCLHEGCIPSKALLHAAEVINTSAEAAKFGLKFQKPEINVDELRTWKVGVTDKLAQGIVGMCKSAGVEILQGRAAFQDSKNLRVDRDGESAMRIKFKHAILASGSLPFKLPKLYKSEKDMQSPRIVDSTGILNIQDIPKSLLVVGGGYIGLEMATVYAALGTEVSVIEMTDGLLPGVDRDLVKPLAGHLVTTLKAIWLNSKLISLEDNGTGVIATMEGEAFLPRKPLTVY